MPLLDNKLSKPIYDIKKSYIENVLQGPCFENSFPERIYKDKRDWISFLGFSLASPLGVPAGPLLTSSWIGLASKLGFDVLTYKTIRSFPYAGHPTPNVVYVKPLADLDKVIECEKEPDTLENLSITNSFGMPSMPPLFLQEDIAKAKALLKEGQVLIVSVVGSKDTGSLQDDFVRTALLAKEAGADIIEANFSCPNVQSQEGSLYLDPENTKTIASALTKALNSTPLIIKVGHFEDPKRQKEILINLARAKVRAVAGINSVSKSVLKEDGSFALGKERKVSGVCGSLIRKCALDFVKLSKKIITSEKLDLELIGGGGIALPFHFDEVLESGAKIAMSATGMMWDPLIASKWHNK